MTEVLSLLSTLVLILLLLYLSTFLGVAYGWFLMAFVILLLLAFLLIPGTQDLVTQDLQFRGMAGHQRAYAGELVHPVPVPDGAPG